MNDILDLKCGDCLELMKDIPDGSIDMILCDLPYGVTHNKWDTTIDIDMLWSQYYRITKPNAAIVLHCMQPFTTQLISSNMKDFRYCWVWNKHQISGFLNSKKRPLVQHEDVAVFYRKQPTYNPQMRKGKLRRKGRTNGSASTNYNGFKLLAVVNDDYYPTSILDFALLRYKDGHPTQKPVELLEYLINTYTNKGDTVLDNCMGSGSTGVACVNTGRNFIGFELDKQYFDNAQKRIEEAVNHRKEDCCTPGKIRMEDCFEDAD